MVSKLILLTPDEYRRWKETRAAVHAALVALSGVCDGAATHDKQGFNGVDTQFGKDLARKKEEWLTLGQVRAARKMLQKYRKQIMRLINIDITLTPEAPPMNAAVSLYARDMERKLGERWRFWGPGSDDVIFPDSPLRIHTEDILL